MQQRCCSPPRPEVTAGPAAPAVGRGVVSLHLRFMAMHLGALPDQTRSMKAASSPSSHILSAGSDQ